jgi:hypothetical protein
MEKGMTDEQADKLIAAVENLSALIERVSRPPVVVTADAGCELVLSYERRGYPVYYIPDQSAEREWRSQSVFEAMKPKSIA